mmetsp:Transcript_6063/g.10831  ORF Transcript_6063/g.10831 Transcript_6063/m.10831 type:complete len:87 (+) Transcript_6063:36-296(+)
MISAGNHLSGPTNEGGSEQGTTLDLTQAQNGKRCIRCRNHILIGLGRKETLHYLLTNRPGTNISGVYDMPSGVGSTSSGGEISATI